ncbi:MAG: nucleoside deaminase [Candidatus Marinimicrobia bacterium]|nr:nucleoside deaminase [Candidatus Neomarinimicrobiota bacterium]MCF7828250.1 nucleoside deaminase [Candidatus Neomarinimicrobiota bacterium]MCF7879575.1 nucleoside deaminase [Candidatus Neomarinimicrobiota bacterium]
MTQHEKYMQAAIESAREGITAGQTPFGACLVQDGKIVAVAHNHVWKSTDITAHAEINAIRKACQELETIDLSDCVIYSTCEPCPMCFSAIHWARIPVIYYGASIADAEEHGFNELDISNKDLVSMGNLDTEVINGIMREECRNLFREWKESPASKAY